jgi:hypothetical protein
VTLSDLMSDFGLTRYEEAQLQEWADARTAEVAAAKLARNKAEERAAAAERREAEAREELRRYTGPAVGNEPVAERDALLAQWEEERAAHINDVACGERRLIACESRLAAAERALRGLVEAVEDGFGPPCSEYDATCINCRGLAALAAAREATRSTESEQQQPASEGPVPSGSGRGDATATTCDGNRAPGATKGEG